MQSISFRNQILTYIDQRYLPHKEVIKECRSLEHGFRAIKELRVRGAPLIGIFACYVVCVVLDTFSADKIKFIDQLIKSVDYLKSSRPTAVNLAWALDRLKNQVLSVQDQPVEIMKKTCMNEAAAIHREDAELCNRIAENGVSLIPVGACILTHCNTGMLATGGAGTALGIIYRAHKEKRNITVYIDETRPLLQGARLTAWELVRQNIKCCLITDNMAAILMKKKMIDMAIVGADRITANGDTANKIGTYGVAVLAHHHGIPFYVAAPFSTFDPSLRTGEDIPIEERNPDEVKKILLRFPVAPEAVQAYNPAFDVTPGKLVSAFITDKGIFRPPYDFSQDKIG